MASEAEVVIKCLNRAVANHTSVPYGDVAQRFWQRLSIDTQREGHKALVRRMVAGVGEGSGFLERARLAGEGLQEPQGT